MSAVELVPFKQGDWYAWAGAEPWADRDPYIAEVTVLDWPEDLEPDLDHTDVIERSVTCIVDAHGVSFNGIDGAYMLDVSDHDLALAVATRLLALPISAAVLRALGFQSCNLPEEAK